MDIDPELQAWADRRMRRMVLEGRAILLILLGLTVLGVVLY